MLEGILSARDTAGNIFSRVEVLRLPLRAVVRLLCMRPSIIRWSSGILASIALSWRAGCWGRQFPPTVGWKRIFS